VRRLLELPYVSITVEEKRTRVGLCAFAGLTPFRAAYASWASGSALQNLHAGVVGLGLTRVGRWIDWKECM
jgi:hypothetical protein